MTLKEEMDSIQWYHPIDLGPELGTTPGQCKNHKEVLEYMHMPARLDGKICLDVGSWDGMFAFEMERRGAAETVATDIWGKYNSPSILHSDRGILFARKVLKSRIDVATCSVYDLYKGWFRAFSVVCFAGVLYHLEKPVDALWSINQSMSSGGLLILETHLDLLSVRRPAMALYPEDECGNDPTNWCGPNPEGVEALLKMARFEDIQFVGGINIDRSQGHEEVNYARGAWHARKR